MFDYVVIGAGLIGSAAARYLSFQSSNMAIIGTPEPQNWSNHKGVFASHYDQGRITRILDKDIVWADLAAKSIAEYAKLELASGIKFHHAVGCLNVGIPGVDSRLQKTLDVAAQLKPAFEQLDATALKTQFPEMQFDDRIALLEHGNAGYINPRSLVAAQLNVATKQAQWIQEEVKQLSFKNDYVEVYTTNSSFKAQKVLVAAGAYSNFLLPEKLDLVVKPQTIIMAELDEATLERFEAMPSIIVYERTEPTVSFEKSAGSEMAGVYVLPPVTYPDGRRYLKMGGHLLHFEPLESAEAFLDWFHSAGANDEVALLKEVLYTLFLSLKPIRILMKPCAFTLTRHARPYIDELIEGRLYVAAGGNGAAAKSSNEMGRLAAQLVASKEDARAEFKAVVKTVS